MLILSIGRGGGVTERLIVDQKVRCHMTSTTTEIQMIYGAATYNHKRSESAGPSLSTLISATGSLGSGCAIPFSLVEGVSSTSIAAWPALAADNSLATVVCPLGPAP